MVFAMLQNKGNPPCGRTPTVIATQTLSCVFSTSAEGNTPRGVPHRVQSNVDAAETPSDGLMPQSHLATLTSFPGAAHHMCTVPLCIFYAFLCTSMHFHAFSMHFFNTNVSCTGRSFPPSHDRQVKKTIPTKLCVLVCFSRSGVQNPAPLP